MPDQYMPFQPGKSGNPAGRPPKERALSTLLEQAGSRSVEVDGKRVPGKRLVADMAWQLAATGRAQFPDGTPLAAGRVDLDEWLALVKWIYAQVDGPPKTAADVTLKGDAANPLIINSLVTMPPVEMGDGRTEDE